MPHSRRIPSSRYHKKRHFAARDGCFVKSEARSGLRYTRRHGGCLMATTTSSRATAGTHPDSNRLTAPARNGAEAVVQLLVACGVDHIFLNPGTDTAPLQEALVALEADGERVPRIVPSL